MTGSVVVIGAINVDLVVSGAPLPVPGQTVTGGVFAQHQGGKEGNQAVAAARALGGQGVVMIGSVGNDALGTMPWTRSEPKAWPRRYRCGPAFPRVALICVGPDGENQISVAPEPNAELTAGDVIRVRAGAGRRRAREPRGVHAAVTPRRRRAASTARRFV